ncbi:polyhydroxyalkanoic acid system family protein [Aliikangiella sp. IMCC44359]|uniref:polyhydroxyalkanoic acid system family protein n=1 Tax=Aliikangiella sp. IMCC44359 TaxID=3459125 RepID=UPI00403B0742
MSVIYVHRNHQLSINELKNRIDQIVVKIQDELEFHTEWETDKSLIFRRKGANGGIEIDEENFALTLRLGIMFRMLKSSIENQVIEIVDKHLK